MDRMIGRPVVQIKGIVSAKNTVDYSNLALTGLSSQYHLWPSSIILSIALMQHHFLHTFFFFVSQYNAACESTIFIYEWSQMYLGRDKSTRTPNHTAHIQWTQQFRSRVRYPTAYQNRTSFYSIWLSHYSNFILIPCISLVCNASSHTSDMVKYLIWCHAVCAPLL